MSPLLLVCLSLGCYDRARILGPAGLVVWKLIQGKPPWHDIRRPAAGVLMVTTLSQLQTQQEERDRRHTAHTILATLLPSRRREEFLLPPSTAGQQSSQWETVTTQPMSTRDTWDSQLTPVNFLLRKVPQHSPFSSLRASPLFSGHGHAYDFAIACLSRLEILWYS